MPRRRCATRPAMGLVTLALALAGAGQVEAQPAEAFVPVTDAMLQNPAPGDWLMWRRALNGWGYSPLDQVHRDNVSDLRMVWTRALSAGSQQGGAVRGAEACRHLDGAEL